MPRTSNNAMGNWPPRYRTIWTVVRRPQTASCGIAQERLQLPFGEREGEGIPPAPEDEGWCRESVARAVQSQTNGYRHTSPRILGRGIYR